MKVLVRLLVLVLVWLCAGAGAGAGAFAQEKVEPIRCWRQSSTGAVSVGEEFTVVLTCAVLDAASIQVVPEEARLGVASIQVSPFEILGGSHPPDVRRGQRRFFQYDYRLRLISADAIGHDVNVPGLSIPYRVRSQVGSAAQLEGRDLSYLVPPLPIKVVSMVPADATDIRDGSDAGFGAVDALRYRANLFRIGAVALGALAVVMAALAFVPLAKRAQSAASSERDRVPDRTVLYRAAQEMDEVQRDVDRDGWSDTTLARALGALRLAGAIAIGRDISRARVTGSTPPEGKLTVRSGLLRSTVSAVSSSITTGDLVRAMNDGAGSVTDQQRIDSIRSVLATFTTAAYQSSPTRDAAALNDALRIGVSAAKALASERAQLRFAWRR